MKIEEILEKLGLNDKEIKVYLNCLEIGESHIIPIAKKSLLPRTTVFHILEKLGQMKLVEIVQKGKRHIYVPYPPKRIITLLKQKENEIEEQIKSTEEIIPELASIYSTSFFQPRVRTYEDEGIKNIYEEILELPIDDAWYVGETNKIVDILGEKYLDSWVKRRVKKKIKSKSIRIRTEESNRPLFHGTDRFLRSIRYAPSDFKCPTHILIYGNNVALMTTGKENFGLVITSKEYAETMRNWFKQLWKVSK